MSRSRNIPIKVPQAVADALERRYANGAFGRYPSRNALFVGVLTYATIFPVMHTLTVEISRMHPDDQDLIHDLILAAAEQGRDLAAELPKPATAAALLALAKNANAQAPAAETSTSR